MANATPPEDRRMMSSDDIDRIAEILIEKIHDRKHNFWIDPEQHYQDHHKDKDRLLNEKDYSDLKQLIEMYQMFRGLFVKAFIGFAIVGATALAGYGLLREFFKS